jgi:hypothetical protein
MMDVKRALAPAHYSGFKRDADAKFMTGQISQADGS